MRFPIHIHDPSAFEALLPEDEAALLQRARVLQAAWLRRDVPLQLKGKNLGIFCCEGSEDEALFQRAARELGAHVATLRPALSSLGGHGEIRHTGQILSRFYDAVECQGMAADVVRQIGREAAIPVYDSLACASHPSARLADRLGELASPADNRRFVLQALLLDSIG